MLDHNRPIISHTHKHKQRHTHGQRHTHSQTNTSTHIHKEKGKQTLDVLNLIMLSNTINNDINESIICTTKLS